MSSFSYVFNAVTTTFLTALLASTLGTFLGNMALLYLISVRATQVERKRAAFIEEMKAKIATELQESIQKQRDYIRMES